MIATMNALLRGLILSFALIAVCGNAALHEHDAHLSDSEVLVCELCTLADGSAMSKLAINAPLAPAIAGPMLGQPRVLHRKLRYGRPYATGPPLYIQYS